MESINAPPTFAGDTVSEPLASASRFSRYVRRLLAAEPDLATRAKFDASYGVGRMRERLAALLERDAALGRALRQLRKEVMLVLIARDLCGRATLGEVMETTTALAEVSTEAAVTHAHAELAGTYGEPRSPEGAAQRLHVVGMGKLGGGELNVSSDVDLILVYPDEGETDGERPIDNHEFFTRLARRLSAL